MVEAVEQKDFASLNKDEKKLCMTQVGDLLKKCGLGEVRVESTNQQFITFMKGKVGEQEYLITEDTLPLHK